MANVPVLVELLQATQEDQLESLLAVAYDRTGQPIAQTTLRLGFDGGRLIGKGEFELEPKLVGDSVRVIVAPVALQSAGPPTARPQRPTATLPMPDLGTRGVEPTNAVAPPTLPSRADLLKRLRGYQDALRLSREQPLVRVVIPRPDWIIWPKLCFCWVRGRLVKRVTLPDGRTLDLPVCGARVTLCEIDRWPRIIARLPDRDLFRLRDDLLDLARRPIPIPDPPPERFPDPILGLQPLPVPGPDPIRVLTLASAAGKECGCTPSPQTAAAVTPVTAKAFDPQPDPPAAMARLNATIAAPAAAVRAQLIADASLLRPYLCGLRWLDALFITHRHCFATVMTDEDGRFSALYVHACGDSDKPDIHVSAEQEIGGAWTSIHAPSISCGTTWDYRCGDEITVVVTDPRARACVPEDPVDPPPGVGAWVMPYAVGAMPIGGTAGTPPPGGWPQGWVRPDGLTGFDTAFTNAPFGSVLGFRQQHSLGIPNDGAYYYRWSFRRGTSGAWTAMTSPITRTYVRDVPGPAVQFPAVLLGPNSANLFRFRPALFNPADWGIDISADPVGTQYYWPVDAGIGEVYAARWTTPGTESATDAPTLAGPYQVLLQVFRKDGVLVVPSASTFQFIVPARIDPDGTVQTRTAAPSELVDGGFAFTLEIDNGRCGAVIPAPSITGTAEQDEDCGFIRYQGNISVGLSFVPTQPSGRARFSFALVRGATNVGSAGASGDIQDVIAAPYTRVGSTFATDFQVATLMDACPNAAFAESLTVSAKATNGSRRLWEYDASALRAFALAQA